MLNLDPLRDLADTWEEEAETLRGRGAHRQAEALESAAEDLQKRISYWTKKPLSPAKAATESGYTADHIRRLIREGKVPNAGDESSPRIERRHVPRKPGHALGNVSGERVGSRSRVARAVLDSDQEAEDG